MYYSNGNIYEGQREDGEWHGNGKLTIYNGEVYEGNYKEGKL